MDSILPWVGGKSRAVNKVLDLMPEHKCYVECFAGGLSIYFAKEPSAVEAVNDLNGELVNFYSVLQNNWKDFEDRSKYELYALELYSSYYRDYRTGKHSDMGDVERAFRFFVLIYCAYSGKFGGGWSYGHSRSKPKSFFELFRSGKIEKISNRLKNTYIDHRDFEDVITGYDSEDTVHFVDPPYVLPPVDDYYCRSMENENIKDGVIMEGFSLYDQQRLYNCLYGMKGKFILTIDDCAWVRERYCNGQYELGDNRKFWWVNNELYYSSSAAHTRGDDKGIKNEFIICNYDIEKEIERKRKRKLLKGSKSLEEY